MKTDGQPDQILLRGAESLEVTPCVLYRGAQKKLKPTAVAHEKTIKSSHSQKNKMLDVMVLMLLGAKLTSSSIICPDGNMCPDMSTCCKTEDEYKCCPYPHAVCCADHSHCCPEGYLCNMQTQTCDKPGEESVPLLAKTQAEEPRASTAQRGQATTSVVHCDGTYVCNDGMTCCRHPGGLYSCCSMSPAHCCLDGYHCCPLGFHCDPTFTQCLKDDIPFPFFVNKPVAVSKATKVSLTEFKATAQDKPRQAVTAQTVGSVIICDMNFYCPMGNTCCKNPAGQWGCCPYSLGQCCKDGKHCCEYGYKCDRTSKDCIQGYLRVSPAMKEAQQF
ncbi:granulins-like [Arapaima gigas]